jgi:GNAT superfamily N-acetyltransferase
MARVHVDSWRAAYRGLLPDERLEGLDPARGAGRFRDVIERRGDEAIYVAEERGKAVGFLALGPCRDTDGPASTGEIYALYLVPSAWRKGTGRAMCAWAECSLRAHGFSRAVLWVLEGNMAARAFYEAVGFRPDGATKVLDMGAPVAGVRYAKTL